MKLTRLLLLSFFILITHVSTAKTSHSIDWENFLSQHDPIWTQLPQKFDHGAFLGNAILGATLFMENENQLRFAMGRSDITDHRYDNGRLVIGGMLIQTKGKILGGNIRTNLWNAQISANIKTDKGEIFITAYTHAGKPIFILDFTTSGSESVSLKWDAAKAIVCPDENSFVNKPFNPDPIFGSEQEVDYCEQSRVAGGSYTAAWKLFKNGDSQRLLFTLADSYPDKSSTNKAVEIIKLIEKQDAENLLKEHRQWWHDFYPASFVSVPDAQIEAFYWNQLYKYASATREDGIVLDLQGPWNRKSSWPRIWWNLNIEIAYYGVYASNHVELSKSFTNFIDAKRNNFARNAKELWGFDDCATVSHTTCYEGLRGNGNRCSSQYINPGDFTWALHLYWLRYRYTMDESLILDQNKHAFYPLLKKSVNLYLNLLEQDDDGNLHLPVLHSPEYSKHGDSDNNYNLSILRWACSTLLYLNDRYKFDDPMAKIWKDTLNRLVPYPTDENGFRIGAKVSFARSHRHWSHLLMVWPFAMLTPDQPENKDVVSRSLKHWLEVGNGKQIFGWSNVAASLLYSTLGDGDNAYKQLKAHHNNKRFVMPNTMYIESSPVIECALFATRALQEMLLQSSNDRIKIFPSMPEHWKDAAYENLRAEGAFLVSAIRKGGETRKVEIKKLANEKCILVPNFKGNFKSTLDATKIKEIQKGVYQIDILKGESVIFYKDDADLKLEIAPCEVPADQRNIWGLKAEN